METILSLTHGKEGKGGIHDWGNVLCFGQPDVRHLVRFEHSRATMAGLAGGR